MGFIFDSTAVPKEMITNLLSAFERLPQRVIFKYDIQEDDNAYETSPKLSVPQNVLVLPWVPQQAILAHPATKVFITHCGMHGVLEAIYHQASEALTEQLIDAYIPRCQWWECQYSLTRLMCWNEWRRRALAWVYPKEPQQTRYTQQLWRYVKKFMLVHYISCGGMLKSWRLFTISQQISKEKAFPIGWKLQLCIGQNRILSFSIYWSLVWLSKSCNGCCWSCYWARKRWVGPNKREEVRAPNGREGRLM